MARIAGVNIPDHKHIVISLSYVYGIGPTIAKNICDTTGIEPSTKVSELSPEQLDGIRAEVAKVPTEGDLRRSLAEGKDIDKITVVDLMTSNPIAINIKSPLKDAMILMEDRKSQISVLPVVNDDGKTCAGLLRLHDIYQANLL